MDPKVALNLTFNSIRNISQHKIGYCPFCETKTFFVSTKRVSQRESLYCIKCHSWSRRRHIAVVLCKVLNVASLSELNKTTIKIYNTDVGGQLDTFFLNNKNYVRSVYPPNISLGTKIDDGVYCQDLEQLTFADESFDVIITEDVLEHVRHYEMAFKEIYRVLKPKGVHVFTVPIGLMQNTVIRVDTSGTEDIFLMPPEYHGDSLRNEGILAYRNFGKDTPELLKEFGFETSIETCANLAAKFGIYNSTVLISKKS